MPPHAIASRACSIDVRIAAADGVLPCGDGTEDDSPGVWVHKVGVGLLPHPLEATEGAAGVCVVFSTMQQPLTAVAFPGARLPPLQGDVVAISPYQSHLDPRLYPEAPARYNPAREGIQLAGGGTAQHGAAIPGVGGVPGLSFGGGKYRCPGRFFAEAELALVTSLLLLLFDWQLLPREAAAPSGGGSGSRGADSKPGSSSQQAASVPGDPAGLLPPPDLQKLVGIKVPAGPCWVQYRRRGSPPQRPC